MATVEALAEALAISMTALLPRAAVPRIAPQVFVGRFFPTAEKRQQTPYTARLFLKEWPGPLASHSGEVRFEKTGASEWTFEWDGSSEVEAIEAGLRWCSHEANARLVAATACGNAVRDALSAVG